MNRPEPKKDEIYRHFKGKNYRIICVGEHSESKERLVAYEQTETHKVCIRPLDMFMSETDMTKYPRATQKYRFELTYDYRKNDPVSKLKPCPFCNTKKHLILEYGRDWTRVACLECRLEMEVTRNDNESIEERCERIIDLWNTRGNKNEF